ncbi:MAG: TrmH family RNA methyltransferase [Candidatus Electrothrix sp. GW3-4]|uniref:TrmH family RNA methyltransferase n=1 Tax=Candidatus Electrothrix sp. GW3-4 TaxID=3126740 RepID=UPI0030D1E621
MARRYNKRLDIETRYEQARRRNLVSAKPGLHEYILVLDGLKPDFNIGKIFRAADAFGAREIHLVGVQAFNPDPAKGSVRWVKFYHHNDFSSCYKKLTEKGYVFMVFEPGCSKLLGSCSLEKKSAFVMGHEEFGISFDRSDYPDIEAISIPQWGHVQSLNVSVAASIVMYEYVRQHGKPISEGLPQKEAGVSRRSVQK